MKIPGCFHYYSSVVELEVRDRDASRSSFIVEDCFGYPVVLVFPYDVEYCSLKVYEELYWDFDGNLNESVDCFWKDCHFYYIAHTYPRTWKIFPFSDIFFNSFPQRKVFVFFCTGLSLLWQAIPQDILCCF